MLECIVFFCSSYLVSCIYEAKPKSYFNLSTSYRDPITGVTVINIFFRIPNCIKVEPTVLKWGFVIFEHVVLKGMNKKQITENHKQLHKLRAIFSSLALVSLKGWLIKNKSIRRLI